MGSLLAASAGKKLEELANQRLNDRKLKEDPADDLIREHSLSSVVAYYKEQVNYCLNAVAYCLEHEGNPHIRKPEEILADVLNYLRFIYAKVEETREKERAR